MKNVFIVLMLMLLSQVLMSAMPESEIEYECKFVPIVNNSESSDVSREIEMTLVCRPVQQKPPKFEVGEGEPRSCCDIPEIIPNNDFRSELKSK